MENEFVIENVSSYCGMSLIFTGMLSKSWRKYNMCPVTFLRDVCVNYKCMEEAIKTDPGSWDHMFHYILNMELRKSKMKIEWLYTLYVKYIDHITVDQRYMGDILFRLGEYGKMYWIKKWFDMDKESHSITSTEWFMALLSVINRGYIYDVRWFFSHTDINWYVEEHKTSFSMAFHAVENIDCFKFISGEMCHKLDVGVIEEFVRLGDHEMLLWSEESGYT